MGKSKISDLAIFDGRPEFEKVLHVGRPNLGDRDVLLSRINTMLDRNWLTNDGPFVHEFERRVEKLLDVKHCIAMCNGTVALEIASRALELKGEVIVPSFTFVATAHALQWQEVTPVFCDINPFTYTLDPAKVEQLITPRTTGILPVHLWGHVCDVYALTEIARKHNLKLMFDASHAFSCSAQGRMVGTFGDAEIFSFHATKFLNTFEGGAVVTNDDGLAEKIRLMKNFGFKGLDRVEYIGMNGKMSEVSAAMGLTSLESIDHFIDVNRRNYKLYKQHLSGVPGIRLIPYKEEERLNYQYIVVELDLDKVELSRDMVVNILHEENVLARRYFYPGCHNMEPYRSYFPHAKLMLPETERAMHKVICLPTGTAISLDEVERLCDLLAFILENDKSIAQQIAKFAS